MEQLQLQRNTGSWATRTAEALWASGATESYWELLKNTWSLQLIYPGWELHFCVFTALHERFWLCSEQVQLIWKLLHSTVYSSPNVQCRSESKHHKVYTWHWTCYITQCTTAHDKLYTALSSGIEVASNCHFSLNTLELCYNPIS